MNWMMWLGGPGTLLALGLGGYYILWPQVDLWWQKDRRQYCEAKLTDYEAKSKAALEKMTLERDALQAKLSEVDNEHQNRVAAMRTRHERAFDSLSMAYADSCRRLSQAPEAASGNDGAAAGDGLRGGVGERLARVAIIADEQTERLVWCQGYVRSLQ